MSMVKPVTREALRDYLMDDQIAVLTDEDLHAIAELTAKLKAADETNGWWDVIHIAAQQVLDSKTSSKSATG